MSGDGAKRDADGYLWITGRIDDMLNCSGHLMSTAQVSIPYPMLLLHIMVIIFFHLGWVCASGAQGCCWGSCSASAPPSEGRGALLLRHHERRHHLLCLHSDWAHCHDQGKDCSVCNAGLYPGWALLFFSFTNSFCLTECAGLAEDSVRKDYEESAEEDCKWRSWAWRHFHHGWWICGRGREDI